MDDAQSRRSKSSGKSVPLINLLFFTKKKFFFFEPIFFLFIFIRLDSCCHIYCFMSTNVSKELKNFRNFVSEDLKQLFDKNKRVESLKSEACKTVLKDFDPKDGSVIITGLKKSIELLKKQISQCIAKFPHLSPSDELLLSSHSLLSRHSS